MTNAAVGIAIELNAYAVELLKVGYLDEGIQNIKSALAVLHSQGALFDQNGVLVAHLGSLAPLPEESLSTSKPFQAKDTRFSSYHSVPIASQISHPGGGSTSDNLFTLYPRAFDIQKSHAHCFGASNVSLVLLYNLAVVAHIKACAFLEANPQTDRRPLLAVVIQLYENVAIASQGSLVGSHDFQEMLCLLIATANNIGFCYDVLGEFSKFRESITLTLDLLSLSSDERYPIPRADMDIFLSSTLIFLESRGRDLCNAPAA
jgi:hypothetical protein